MSTNTINCPFCGHVYFKPLYDWQYIYCNDCHVYFEKHTGKRIYCDKVPGKYHKTDEEVLKEKDRIAISDRKDILLRAAYDILTRCNRSHYVLDANETCAFYDGTDCDGNCLREDIAAELDFDPHTDPITLIEEVKP